VITHCPHCNAWFRVQAEQLRQAHGRVRCGACREPFDALAELRDEPCLPPPGPEPAPPSPGREAGPAWIWVLGSLLLAVLLGIQLLWWQRDRLAASPAGRPWAQALCRLLPCEARPPRRPDRIEVVSRDLAPDPSHPGTLKFHLEIANRAPMVQPWPRIDLVLTGVRGETRGGLRLYPKDYLPADHAPWFPPGQEVQIHLRIADTQPPSSGFRIAFH